MVDRKQFRIGVVIVNFNSGDCLSLCLRSLSNSHAPLDVVVVDNQSSDQSAENIQAILSNPHKLKLIRNKENIGFSRAVNQGMLSIDNRFVVMLNPDCTIFPYTFLSLQKSMVSNKNVAVAGAAIFNHDGSEQRGCRRNEPTLVRSAATVLGLTNRYEGIDLTNTSYPSHPTSVDAVSGAAMMVRREYFDELGGMDEDYFLHCEDLDVCRRFRDSGYDVIFCPSAGVFHRKGASSGVTTNKVEKHKHDGMLIYNQKHSTDSGMKKWATVGLIKAHYCLGVLANLLQRTLSRFKREVNQDGQNIAEFNSLDIVHNTRPVIILTGSKSDVGDFILKLLPTAGYQVYAISRHEIPDLKSNAVPHIHWLKLDYFIKCSAEDFGEVEAWINLAPVWTTRSLAKVFHKFKPKRLISLSSTSIEGKYDSDNEKDIAIVNQLTDGEKWIQHYSEKFEVDSTIFRPTLIYGGPRNQNVNFIKQVIRIFRFFPVVGKGAGKRQPIHAEDIATVCLFALKKSRIPEFKTYNITGDDTLSYAEFLEKIFQSMNLTPRLLTLSMPLVKSTIAFMSKLPGLQFLNPEMVERTQKDLVYSTEATVKDLGFESRKFSP